MKNNNKRYCPECKEELKGRVDKKFCTPYCKSSYHYKKNRDDENNWYKKVDNQLKLNRRLLKNYNKSGKSTVRKELLLKEGFNPKFITHWWKNKQGNVYFFCFDYGFLAKIENNKEKYVLVKYQKYME